MSKKGPIVQVLLENVKFHLGKMYENSEKITKLEEERIKYGKY